MHSQVSDYEAPSVSGPSLALESVAALRQTKRFVDAAFPRPLT